MNITFYYSLFAFLLPRLYYQWSDEKNTIKVSIKLFVWNAVLLLPLISTNWYWLVLILIVSHLIIYYLETIIQNTNFSRITQFLLILLLTSSFFGKNSLFSHYNNYCIEMVNRLSNNNVIFQSINTEKAIIAMLGLLIVTNESNHLIRFILQKIKVEPKNNKNRVDKNELDRGKIIGIIERIILFIFTVTGNYSSIGFILAAKGFTRFKELDNRDFAEYVLIGTLLSASITILIGILFSDPLLFNNY